MPVTPNYNWTLPTPDGDVGTWDTILNTAFGDIDTDLKTVSDTADAAQADATSALTAATDAVAGLFTLTAVAVTPTGGDPYAATLDLSLGTVFDCGTITTGLASKDFNLTFTNRPGAGTARLALVRVTANLSGASGSSRTIHTKINPTNQAYVYQLPLVNGTPSTTPTAIVVPAGSDGSGVYATYQFLIIGG